MASTYTERLQLVRDAIDAILLGGQDVQFDGKRVVEADLSQLRQLESVYEQRAARESRGGRMRTHYGAPS